MKGDDLALIVMDLEWTAWEGSSQRHWTGPGEEMEIVQIGITQDRLDRDGVDLKTGLGEFAEFIGPSTEAFGFGDEFTHIVTNCQLYGLANPFADCRCADVRPAVMAHLGINWVPNSSELPGLMDFTPPGAMHQGLADSRCVAEALRRARKAGRF